MEDINIQIPFRGLVNAYMLMKIGLSSSHKKRNTLLLISRLIISEEQHVITTHS